MAWRLNSISLIWNSYMSTFVVVSFTGHRIHWLCDFDYIFCITACIYPSMINYMFRKWILYYIILYFCVRIYYIFSEKYTILYYIILYFDLHYIVVTLYLDLPGSGHVFTGAVDRVYSTLISASYFYNY